MAKNFRIPFAKYHALGNDFIVLDLPKIFHKLGDQQPREKGFKRAKGLDPSTLARSMCDRRAGIGADGLILVVAPAARRHHAKMYIFNADGSEAEMSGNGIRCAAAYLLESRRRGSKSTTIQRGSRGAALQVETLAGAKMVRLLNCAQGTWTFQVGMGAPILEPSKIPFRAGDFPPPIVGFPLRTQRGLLPVTVTSIGNPHCTVFVADFAAIDWTSLGREIESNELFPGRTNVEFVRVLSRDEIEVRFWERGVGQTLSSGTGSCAAVVACVLNGLTERNVRVRMRAGILQIAWPDKGEITLTGPVERIAHGTYYSRG